MSKSRPNTLTIAGAVLAYLIGSGFASGQEVLQYFVPFGRYSIFTALLVAVVLILCNSGFAHAGEVTRNDPTGIFVFFCGKKAGVIFRWVIAGFAFLFYGVMLAGAGSALMQQYHLPLWVGVAIMTVVTVLTVSLGLNKLVDIISRVGPLLAALVLFIGIFTLINYNDQLSANLLLIENEQVELLASADSWWLSGLLSGGMNLLVMCGFMAQLGHQYGAGRIMAGQSLGIFIYSGICLLMSFALTCLLPQVTQVQIPNLVLAANIHPALAGIFGIIIFIAIFTSASPLLWTAATRIFPEGSMKFKATVMALGAVGSLLALAVPFATLVNRIFVAEGIVGILLFILLLRKLPGIWLKRWILKNQQDNTI